MCAVHYRVTGSGGSVPGNLETARSVTTVTRDQLLMRLHGRCLLFVVSCVAMASFLDSLSLMPRKVIDVIDLSERCIDYRQAWAWQSLLVDRHVSQQTPTTAGAVRSRSANTDVRRDDVCVTEGHAVRTGSLLVLQHKSVYTLGSGTKASSGPFGFTASDGHPLVYESVQVDRYYLLMTYIHVDDIHTC